MKEYVAERPLVSVVIPVYNRMDMIERSINSVLNQTYKNIEIIVIDDGSIDDTLKIIEHLSISDIKVLKQNHRGANAARNLGISAAKGEFIAFQDSDDEWLPNKLEKQITYMLRSSYEACYCPFFLYEGSHNGVFFSDYQDKQKYERDLLEMLKVRNVISTQTLVIHRNIISDVGIFDEEMPRCQDYEFVIRIIQKKKIGYINEPLVKVYRTDNSISNDEAKQKEANIILLRKYEDFFNIELCLENIFKYNINGLNETELKKEVERIDQYLKKTLNKRKVNVYKVAMETLIQKYIFNGSCSREYELRINRLKSYEFAIYGAGKIGKQVYLELSQKNLIPKCFLVTNRQGEDELFGIPILELAQMKNKNLEIIIGVSQYLQFSLIENLIREGYMNYFRYPY
ncbi:MAG: glycosyltransferase [Dorea sp.]|nr:glycosyltransferase [Dorea sp.]